MLCLVLNYVCDVGGVFFCSQTQFISLSLLCARELWKSITTSLHLIKLLFCWFTSVPVFQTFKHFALNHFFFLSHGEVIYEKEKVLQGTTLIRTFTE